MTTPTPTQDETLTRLARLLVLRQIDLHNAERPIDRKIAAARLDGAADATYRVVDGYGPEQVLNAVRESVTEGRSPTPGGYRAWFDDRCEVVAAKLALIQRDEAALR